MFSELKYEDLHLEDLDLYLEYINLQKQNKVEEAKNLITNNEDRLRHKSSTAISLNVIRSLLLNLQNTHNEDINVKLEGLLESFDFEVGKLIDCGEYINDRKYEVFNSVYYTDNKYYHCIQSPPVGTLPTNTTYWKELNLIGKKGASSLGIEWRDNWNQFAPYIIKDVVIYDGTLWIAVNANINSIPSDSNPNWLLLFQTENVVLPLGYNAQTEVKMVTGSSYLLEV